MQISKDIVPKRFLEGAIACHVSGCNGFQKFLGVLRSSLKDVLLRRVLRLENQPKQRVFGQDIARTPRRISRRTSRAKNFLPIAGSAGT